MLRTCLRNFVIEEDIIRLSGWEVDKLAIKEDEINHSTLLYTNVKFQIIVFLNIIFVFNM